MASLERMTTLSTGILKNTQILTDYLKSKGREAPSFEIDGLTSFPIDESDEEVVRARMELVGMTKELHDIALGPREGLRDLSWDVGILFLFG
jgi:hypothetical protein